MPKNVKRLLVGLGVIALAVGGAALASGAVANADTSSPSCQSAFQHTDRQDNGHFGHWADLSLTRTVEICSTTTDNTYTATITDEGKLTTIAGAALSPREGKPLAGGVTGAVHGTYHWRFQAENLVLAKVPSAHVDESGGLVSTENWVKTLVESIGAKWCSGSGADYNWTYTTCAEKWVDASDNNDGGAADAGDITGLKCTVPVTPELVQGKCTGPNAQSDTTFTVSSTEGIQYQDGKGSVSGKITLKPNQEFTLFAHVLAGYTVVDLPKGWFDTGDGYDFGIKLTAPAALDCAPRTTPAPPSTPAPKPPVTTHTTSHHAAVVSTPQTPAVSPAAQTSSLASTGARTGLLGGIAVALLGLGGLALLAGRRRGTRS